MLIRVFCIISVFILSSTNLLAGPYTEIANVLLLIKNTDTSVPDGEKFGEIDLARFSEMLERLGAFHIEYGYSPTTHPMWKSVQQAALTKQKSIKPLISHKEHYISDSAAFIDCALTFLSGKPKVAHHMLSKLRPHGWCGNWYATVFMAVTRFKSLLYQLEGRNIAALGCIHLVFHSNMESLHKPAWDLLMFRCAHLSAITAQSRCFRPISYWLVSMLYPKTRGGDLAMKFTLKHNPETPKPTLEDYKSLLIDRMHIRRRQAELIEALVVLKFKDTYKLFLKFINEWHFEGNDVDREHMIEALGSIGDKRAIPSLLKLANKGSLDERQAAYISLLKLGHPDTLSRYIEFVIKHDLDTERAHILLSRISKKAPDFGDFFDVKNIDFKSKWNEYFDLETP